MAHHGTPALRLHFPQGPQCNLRLECCCHRLQEMDHVPPKCPSTWSGNPLHRSSSSPSDSFIGNFLPEVLFLSLSFHMQLPSLSPSPPPLTLPCKVDYCFSSSGSLLLIVRESCPCPSNCCMPVHLALPTKLAIEVPTACFLPEAYACQSPPACL